MTAPMYVTPDDRRSRGGPFDLSELLRLPTLDRQEQDHGGHRQRSGKDRVLVVGQVNMILLDEEVEVLGHRADDSPFNLDMETSGAEQGSQLDEPADCRLPRAIFGDLAPDDATGIEDFPGILEQRRPALRRRVPMCSPVWESVT